MKRRNPSETRGRGGTEKRGAISPGGGGSVCRFGAAGTLPAVVSHTKSARRPRPPTCLPASPPAPLGLLLLLRPRSRLTQAAAVVAAAAGAAPLALLLLLLRLLQPRPRSAPVAATAPRAVGVAATVADELVHRQDRRCRKACSSRQASRQRTRQPGQAEGGRRGNALRHSFCSACFLLPRAKRQGAGNSGAAAMKRPSKCGGGTRGGWGCFYGP